MDGRIIRKNNLRFQEYPDTCERGELKFAHVRGNVTCCQTSSDNQTVQDAPLVSLRNDF